MVSMNLDQIQFEALLSSFTLEDSLSTNAKDALGLFLKKLAESASSVRRCRERALDEASHALVKLLLFQFNEPELYQRLVRILLTLQMESNTSSACRKIDQMLQRLAHVEQALVCNEFQQCVEKILHQEQVLSLKDLQLVCMFLEDSVMGRDVLRQAFTSLLDKVTELLPVVMKENGSRNGPLCYQTVKVCLQVFQLLPELVAKLVFDEQSDKLPMRKILEFLMNVILGEVSNRDTRLLAGTAVAMLICTATDNQSGGSSAWSLLQVRSREQWSLTIGGLQADCCPRDPDGVDRLAVVRGILTCCRKDILLSRHNNEQSCLLLDGLFPLISGLRKEKVDYHYYVFQVFTMWLKSVKECLPEIWEVTGAPFLGEDSKLQHTLTQIIWDNAESPVEGVAESVRTAFDLLLEMYELDCQHYGDTEKKLYVKMLQRISDLPWECKAKYSPLSALLPYVGTDKVLEQYPSLPSHILKGLSTNHLSPCASEIYKALLQEQKRELTLGRVKEAPPTEMELANHWASRWQDTVLKALTSDVTLLQNNASSYLLPCTLRSFPGAFDTLLPALNPSAPGHLRAWAYIMSAQRVTSGHSPWTSGGDVAVETLQLALSSLDTGVRLAAVALICCSPKSKEAPSQVEYSTLKGFLPLNLNSESSPFRQHLQAAVRKFLVRIRDSCMANLKNQKSKKGLSLEEEKELKDGVDFVDWLSQLPLASLTPGNSFQRKRTALLLLAAVLETCSDSWSPERKKGQPPANMAALIKWARERGKWDFFSRSRQLVLIGCLEDVTNEIREHAAELLVRFFPRSLQPDVAAVLFSRAERLLQSPRVQEAQMGALMVKLLLQKCADPDVRVGGVARGEHCSASLIRYLLKSLELQYQTAKEDMLQAAHSSPLHGVVSALQRCLLEVPGVLTEALDHAVTVELLSMLEKITQLLLGVLYGDQHLEDKEVPPSFCDMGNAISSLIGQGGAGLVEEGEEAVLLSEEHSLVLTCCWVSLKEIGIFLGSLVERILSLANKDVTLLTKEDLQGVSKVFKDIILKCRHWGAVEGCCIGFTKFCSALLKSSEPEHREIPAHIVQQGLSVLQSPRSTSVTRRAAGLPMLILGVLAAEDSSSLRPLLSYSMNTLLETARAPLPQDWDQTLDLPQVCAVHTLQALVKGSSLGLSVLQYAPEVAMLSLTLLSSPCWAMRNAALQLYSSLCSRMLGQRPAGEEVSAQYSMSPPAFFSHYPALQPFLQGALESAAADLHDSRLSLHPSLYPVLTLLAKLQPGTPEQTRALSDFLPPLLQLAASPVYDVRVMSSRALVAMIPPTEWVASAMRLVGEIPESPAGPHCHNRVHGQLLQIKAVLGRALPAETPAPSSLGGVVEGLEARLWLASPAQRCPLVRQAYVAVLRLLRRSCSGSFLSRLGTMLVEELHRSPHILELGSASFHQCAADFLCEDPEWAEQMWQHLSSGSAVVRLSLVKWVQEGRSWRGSGLQRVMERALQANLKEALLDQDVEYKGAYLTALLEVTGRDVLGLTQTRPLLTGLEAAGPQECIELLLEDLEGGSGGPELLSQTLCALSLLLSQNVDLALLQRWCVLMETHRRPEAPEALRLACAQALGLSGAVVVTTSSLRGSHALKTISTRLISIGVHLLQDESQQVRDKAAVFASLLCQPRLGVSQQPCLIMQISQSLHSLLDLLLREFWDSEGTLEALVCHLPDCDLNNILQEAKLTQRSSLYEQDQANVFLEPSVISEAVLPHLLCLAKRHPESSSLAKHLEHWAQQSAASIRKNLNICLALQLGDFLDPDWLSLLMEPCFHGALCGLYARAATLLQLLRVSDNLRHLLDSLTLTQDLLVLHERFRQHGVFLPNSFIESVRTD